MILLLIDAWYLMWLLAKSRSQKEIWSKIVGFWDSPFWKLPKLIYYQWQLANLKHLTIGQSKPLYNQKRFFFSLINYHIYIRTICFCSMHPTHLCFPWLTSTQASHWTLDLWDTILVISPKVTTTTFYFYFFWNLAPNNTFSINTFQLFTKQNSIILNLALPLPPSTSSRPHNHPCEIYSAQCQPKLFHNIQVPFYRQISANKKGQSN